MNHVHHYRFCMTVIFAIYQTELLKGRKIELVMTPVVVEMRLLNGPIMEKVWLRPEVGLT